MRHTHLIVRYRSRAFARRLREQAFSLFVLGPVLVGGVLWAGDRLLGHTRPWIVQGLNAAAPTPWEAFRGVDLLSLGLVFLLTALGMPSVLRELYGSSPMADLMDGSPVDLVDRFRSTFWGLSMRALIWAPGLFLVVLSLASRPPSIPRALLWLASVLFMLLALAAVQIPLALIIGRRRWLSTHHLLAALALLVFLSAIAPLRILLAPWVACTAQLRRLFREAMELPRPPSDFWFQAEWTESVSLLCLTLFMGSFLGHQLYQRWYRRDVETLRHLLESTGRRFGPDPSPTSPLIALVRRDLRGVRRGFSQVVPLALALATTLTLGIFLLLEGWPTSLGARRLAVLFGTLAVLAAVSIVPFLVRHQLPRFWLERSTGVDEESIWKAKAVTALLLALPVWALGLLALSPLLHEPRLWIEAILQATATSFIVASLVGLTVFELAEQPVLGLLLSAFASLAVAALFIFYPKAWWLWLALYGYVAGQVAGRAGRRVQLMELLR